MFQQHFKLLSLCSAAIFLAGCGLAVETVDHLVNRVDAEFTEVVASDRDMAKHWRLFVADLHADTLLWERDMFARSDFGHVDAPRLHVGNVSLQIFTVATNAGFPTEMPVARDGQTECHPADATNLISVLTAFEGRRIDSWFDLETRALDQADRLKAFEARSRLEPTTQRLIIIRTGDDLAQVIASWREGLPVIGAVLGLEAVHWLGDARSAPEAEAGVQRLFDAGFRQLALTHQFDNGLAGASEGCVGYGLTPVGRVVLAKAEQLGMVLDLAHLSSAALQEAAAMARSPVVVSHAGMKGSCRSPCNLSRNLSDAEIEAVAKNGGVIGVGYWHEAVGRGLPSIVDAMAYAISVLSRPNFVAERKRYNPNYDPYDHIGFGSDFDGVVATPIDASQLALLTAEMRRYHGPLPAVFTEDRIRKIAGGNICRVYTARLPRGSLSPTRPGCGAVLSGRG